MTTQMNYKFRVVRCPKCSKLLPEMAEVPVYQCGGCGAVLKAKIRKTETKDMELHKPDSTQGSSGSKDQGDSSSGESVRDKSNEERQSDYHSSTDHENPVNQDNRVDQNERKDEDDPGNNDLSDQATSPPEPGNATSSAEPGDATSSAEPGEARSSAEPIEATSSPEQGKATSSAESGEAMSSAEPDEATSSTEPGEASPSTELNVAASSAELGQATSSTEPNYENGSSSHLPEIHLQVNGSKSFEQIDQADQNEFGDDTESDENRKIRPISKSSSEESFLSSTRIHSFATAQRSFADSILTENLEYSPPMEEMNQGQNRLFERISSTDTLENLPRVSTELEPSFTLDNISKSPTTKSHYAYYGSESSCNENEFRAQNRHFHAPKRIFKDKGEFLGPTRHVSRVPLYPRGTQASPSTYGHNKFEYNSIYERDRPESSKVELLKMVCELQDQLDRKYKHPFRYSQGENWPSQPFPANRNAFSSEVSHFRHQVDCSCLRCLPKERHYSAQLPRHHMSRQNPSYYDSSSPIHYTGSEFSSWSRENNQRQHKDRDFKKVNISEKKRHCRPVAGGSPIIVCYKCSSLLQIPADFLVFKKRFHLLRCYECSGVLKFSVIDGVHLVRYILPDADTSIAPPPSEVDEHNNNINNNNNTESVTKRLRNLDMGSDSRVSEPISSSVDYGRSSTDGEFQTTVTSFEPVKERNGKSVMNEKSKSRKNGSPLHRLMGYASPSKVWRDDCNGV